MTPQQIFEIREKLRSLVDAVESVLPPEEDEPSPGVPFRPGGIYRWNTPIDRIDGCQYMLAQVAVREWKLVSLLNGNRNSDIDCTRDQIQRRLNADFVYVSGGEDGTNYL